jgi:hypothetical protein
VVFRAGVRRLPTAVAAVGLLVAAVVVPLGGAARADTAPPSGTPATVSADALPTVQVDGIVWKEAIHGNTVYATGQFSVARPAGVAPGGAGTARANLLAFDIRTGALLPFDHPLGGTDAEGRAVAVSPDGTRLYVGGHFTTVDGQPHRNFAVIDLTADGGAVLDGSEGPNDKVLAITATDTAAYVGGWFDQAGGQPRKLVAAYTREGDLDAGFVADVTGGLGSHVAGLVAVPSTGNLVIGGSFNQINGQTYYSNGAVKLADGSDVTPWASQDAAFPITMQPPVGVSAADLGITSLSTDNTKVYLSAFAFVSGPRPGSFEGTAAIDPADGHLIFLNDCVGDTHDAFPVGPVLYSVSHAHSCAPIGGYPQLANHWQHALAQTTYATGVNGPGNGGNYPSYQGRPRGTLLDWFPELTPGNASGAHDAAWTVVGNSQYIALGGEFPTVNGKPQQGLVRFAVRSLAPNKVWPSAYAGAHYGITASPADGSGRSRVRVFTVGDMDNGVLTYRVYRTGSSRLLATRAIDSRFWKATSWTFTDSGLPPGTSADYRVVVSDPLGNSRTLNGVTVVDDTDSRIAYGGVWTNYQHGQDARPDFARGIHFTKRNGDYFRYAFYGRSIQLIGEKQPTFGTANVSIDGGAPIRISQYYAGTSSHYQLVLFTKSGLSLRRHVITVTKTGGTYIGIDAMRVTPDAAYDDTSPTITYRHPRKWTRGAHRSTPDFGRTLHYTKVNGEYATVHFTGTAVTLIGEKNAARGRLKVSVDGGAAKTVSAHRRSGILVQQAIFAKSGLRPGRHSLRITKVSGRYMDIDAVLVR